MTAKNAQNPEHTALLTECAGTAAGTGPRGGIGTLGEKSLHAALKLYYEPDSSRHEIPVGQYVADIVNEEGIIEIQTKHLSSMPNFFYMSDFLCIFAF